jgi:hypothetical protein
VTALESEIVIMSWKRWVVDGFVIIIIISFFVWWVVGLFFEEI